MYQYIDESGNGIEFDDIGSNCNNTQEISFRIDDPNDNENEESQVSISGGTEFSLSHKCIIEHDGCKVMFVHSNIESDDYFSSGVSLFQDLLIQIYFFVIKVTFNAEF